MSKFRYELAARVLYEAELIPDSVVAKKYNLCDRTVERYRQRLSWDEKLSDLVQKHREMAIGAWAREDAQACIKAAIQRIHREIETIDLTSPRGVEAYGQLLKVVADISITQMAIEQKLQLQQSIGGSGGSPQSDRS